MENILEIGAPVVFDERIAGFEIHAHQPYTGPNYDHSDEIRIMIQTQDMCILPSRSYLHITGQIMVAGGENRPTASKFVNNAICHLLEDIRYELNGVEIDRCRNVGISTLMRGLVTLKSNPGLINAGWLDVAETKKIEDDNGWFDVSIPLSMIFGFASDYQKIIVNMKHELICRRTTSDINAIKQSLIQRDANLGGAYYEDISVKFRKFEWCVPEIILSASSKINLINEVKKGEFIPMPYRATELSENPKLIDSTKVIWPLKTATQIEKPRYAFVAFQTNRVNERNKNASNFDSINLVYYAFVLSNRRYPYNGRKCNFDKNEISMSYNDYLSIHKDINSDKSIPLLSREEWKNSVPIFGVDCSKQNDSLKSAPVDVSFEFETSKTIPDNTKAYCLLLFDRIVAYNPLTGEVRKY